MALVARLAGIAGLAAYGVAVAAAAPVVNVVALGQFTAPGARAAQWDGSAWTALGTGFDNLAMTAAMWRGDLFVGGFFATAGDISVGGVARWDGAQWSALASGTDGSIRSAVAWGDVLVVGGAFASPATNIA